MLCHPNIVQLGIPVHHHHHLQSQGSHSQCPPLAASSFAFDLSLPALPIIVPAFLGFSPIAQKSGQKFFLICKGAKSMKDFQIQSV